MAQHAMKMLSMQRPKDGEPGSERAMPAMAAEHQPRYGYGLVIRLEDFELDKLKIRTLPKAGEKVRIEAEGYVDTVHESQAMHNQGERSVAIQLTDLAVHRGAEAAESS